MSTLTNGLSTGKQLKSLSVGECFIVSLKDGISQNRVMKNNTALCVRLGIKITQVAYRGIPCALDNNAIINLVQVYRVS
tara:strand:- start:952 stop:1188 length:237 start_codon:yes stop_codon:yes gene_type:complete